MMIRYELAIIRLTW